MVELDICRKKGTFLRGKIEKIEKVSSVMEPSPILRERLESPCDLKSRIRRYRTEICLGEN